LLVGNVKRRKQKKKFKMDANQTQTPDANRIEAATTSQPVDQPVSQPLPATQPAVQPAPGETTDPDKFFISYLVLAVFLVAFVLATVGLGLLVSLVNTDPKCDLSSLTSNRFNRVKRDLFENKDQLTILRELMSKKIKVDPPYCDELFESPIGQPWEKKRLPTNFLPLKYEITLRTPIFAAEIYNGEVTIQVKVRQPTDTIVLHSRFLTDYLPTIREAATGREIEVKCVGDFLPNDYFVIKTVETLGLGDYSIDLFYTGQLDVFSSGIFEIKYSQDGDEFEGLDFYIL
jgi:hypothetical protein